MKELKGYYRQIGGWLPCGGRLKKQLMGSIQSTVEDYRKEHPEADFAEIQTHFGTPQQIACGFVDEMSTEDLLTALRIRRKIISIVVAIAIAAIALWGTVLTIALADELSASNGHGQYEIME